MLYAKVENGSVVQYPYEIANLRKDNPNVSFPKTVMEDEHIRTDYGVVEVLEAVIPSDDVEVDDNGVVTKYPDNNVTEGAPIKVNGDWKQVWEQTPKTELERDEQVRAIRLVNYGSPEKQLEFIAENGLEAWQDNVAEIKARYPKL
jgi:hypothetical protein